jgi:lysophospholipase L1-like esterase
MRWVRRVSVLAIGGLLVGYLAQAQALAAPAASAHSAAAAHTAAGSGRPTGRGKTAPAPGPVRLADPGKVLPSGWQRSSDVAVAVSGDATGLHVLAAREASGYAWRTVATLGAPGVETDLWIGQACVTASGAYAVVVYAPEQAANMAEEQGVLGRAAIVNLRNGAVRELGGGFSIAYFDPGCGTGSQAVLTRGGWANDTSNAAMSTTLVLADAATGKVSAPVKVAGQVTSAVPYRGQIAAAGGRGLEQVSTSGKTRLLAAAKAVPFRLTPGADGSLGYQTMAGKRVDLWQLAGERSRMVASAAAGSVELRQIGGRVWLVGPAASKVAGLPRTWKPVDAPAVAQPSTGGALAVTDAVATAPVKGQRYNPGSPQPVAISTKLLVGKRGTASFKVATAATSALPSRSPAGADKAALAVAARAMKAARAGAGPTASRAAVAQTAGSSSTPVSADRTCAVPIDDPAIQAYQPNFQQVEWAADQAVQGSLTDTRGPNLYGSSLPSYTPQGLFPLPSVDGGGSLPAQVLLGVLTAESNLQQASQHVIQGQTANPLTSFNWYGNWTHGETDNTGLIDWSNSDCGYGIGQITSGMCLAQGQNNDNQCAYQTPGEMSSTQQLAVAVDYQANIAKSASLLIKEWNTLLGLGIYPTDGVPVAEDPNNADYIGEWYMAIWAYNSGIEPGSPDYGNTTGCTPGPDCTDNGGAGGNWGLGYADNPINPAYPPDRPTFPGGSSNPTPTGTTYSVDWDMSHPQYWPYQEKVIAWAFDSITLWDYSQGANVQAFAYAPGNTEVPALDTFCVPGTDASTPPGNNCDASGVDTSLATAPDSCQLANDHCWWHNPAALNPTTVTNGENAACVLNLDCGLGVITYPAGAADPGPEPIAAQFAQTCASTLPSNAVIVGDGGQSALGCPGKNWTSQGSFTWDFAPDANGNYSSKIDFDQIGAGFGGHFWFGYAQPSDEPSDTLIAGTWNPPSSVSGLTDIQVALPSYGANADGAIYIIDPGGGKPDRGELVDQGALSGANTWVNLGEFVLGSGASVSLTNVTAVNNGSGVGSDLAWSAAAFIPVSGPSWAYTAMGDSYSSGEGNTPYDAGNDGCDRSPEAFGRQFAAKDSAIGSEGIQHIACSGATIDDLMPGGTGQNGEEPQIDQMYPGSQLVTVTIGGNDIGFAPVLTYCLLNSANCESQYDSNNSNNLYYTIDKLEPKLEAAYEAIQSAAPEADVVAVTYPVLFQPGTGCLGLTVPDVEFLNNVGFYLDDTIVKAAQAAGINVLDERYAFTGHELCSPSGDSWIFSPPSFGVGDEVLDTSAWFHPNADGQGQIADDLAAYWQQLQTGTAPTIWPQTVNSDPAGGWMPLNLPYGLPSTEQAADMLAALPENAPPPTNPYNGNAKYWGWSTRPTPDFPNGCSTRYIVLPAQALTQEQWPQAVPYLAGNNSCLPLSGSWEEPYDLTAGAPTTPVRVSFDEDSAGIAATLPVDHVVPRSNAWASGASTWPTAELEDFANDMSGPELLTVSNSSNSIKQDNPPEDWMPDNPGLACAYVKMWIAVKWDWNLAVSTEDVGTINGEDEKTFLQNTLSNSC